MRKTKHRYIEKYPIKETDRYLILGSIHPDYESKAFAVDFFYGNQNSLWNTISEACGVSLDSLEEILSFLTEHKIAISDMILECERCDLTATKDSDIKPIEFNTKLKDDILNSNIETVFFTSAFSENNAAKLFFREFCLIKPSDWSKERDFEIDFFGRKIRCIVLYSPSGEANRGIAGSVSYKKALEKNSSMTVKAYRNEFYRQKLCDVIDSDSKCKESIHKQGVEYEK